MRDVIYRDDAINEVRFNTFNTLNADEREMVINRIPSADVVPKHDIEIIIDEITKRTSSAEAVQGEWVRKYDDKVNCYWYECDQCGEYRPRNQFGHEYNANFCPNCGAKMKGGDDE